ncbi:MAG TPA: cyanophycin synthetase [Victivallales bacterium]|nr:cyanophycin synthetase [Victivallales bacterium]
MGINILELRALRGPNRYSRRKTMFMLLDIGEFESKPSDEIPGFTEGLLKILPSLKEHHCSLGKPGGFVERLEKGTWIGHIIEHVAIELQCLSGMAVKFGKAFTSEDEGVYAIVFHYQVESAGLYAAEEAIWLVESVIYNEDYDLDKTIQTLKELREDDKMGPSTQSIVDEAVSRGIPYVRLNTNSFVQLGYGKYQKHIQASMTSETSAIGVEIADEKAWTKEILKNACIPVPDGEVVFSWDEAQEIAEDIGYPVVVKPEIGNHGRGITVNINDVRALGKAFDSAKAICKTVIVEQFLEGDDYRMLVIDGNLIAAAHRVPPHVVGDGKSTIQELIDDVNQDSRRGFGHENVLTKITVDEMTLRLLKRKKFKLNDILRNDETLYLKSTANLSQGGTAVDVTDIVHPEIRLMAIRTANIVGMDIIGIDFLAEDITKPISEQRCGIVEVNAAPGLRMHLQPSEGKPRNVAKPIIDMLFPEERPSSMPILAVTGTNGKTTVSKLLTHVLKYNGNKVGLATTTGVEIDGIPIASGDFSGPMGHQLVLGDATVDHAVLETARGAIIRRGLAYERCDVGIFLNVGADHIGTDLVYSVEDLALVKSIVVEVVKDNGTSVLNAENEYVMAHLHRAKGKVFLFSLDPENDNLKKHIEGGGFGVTVVDNNIIIRTKELDKHVASVNEIPITFGGAADFNVANTLAVIAGLYGLGLKREQIKNGITTFYPSAKQNPGRMNIFGFNKSKVILDYGHNKHAIDALAKMLPKLSDGRKIAVSFGTGSRTDEALIEFGETISKAYDHVILADPDRRDRKVGETCEIVKKGMLDKGFNGDCIEIINDFNDAVGHALDIVEEGEIVIVQIDADVDSLIDQMLAKKEGEFFSYSGI